MDGTILGKKYNLMNGGGGGGGSFTVKTKKYPGTGTTSIEHDFGEETPKVIFAISVDPEFNNENKDWHFINCFPWGCKMTEVRWNTGSNNAPNPSGNGGQYSLSVSYNGNKMTITGRDKGAVCNIENIDYLIWYI